MLMTRHAFVLGGCAALLTACGVASNPWSPIPTAPVPTAREGDLPVRQVLPNGLG